MVNSMSRAEILAKNWETNPRWKGIRRLYGPPEVIRLSGTVQVEHTLARMGSLRFWEMLQAGKLVRALGAMTGLQAVQQVQAGLDAVYVSGWQVAADNNSADETYPDLSLYPADSVPRMVRRINNALIRADQIDNMNGTDGTYWMAPIVADMEAGFGGVLNTFELTRALIAAGVAAVHIEDQVSALKKCGHMGGKVLVPGTEMLEKLSAARMAADICGVPTVIVARTDAHGAQLLSNDIDPVDHHFLTGKRTREGFFYIRGGVEYAIAKGRSYAPHADVVWAETATPDIGEAREFAQGIHERFPDKPLAYNCSPSFNWKRHLSARDIATFQEQLAEMGYRFQFVTLAGFHTVNYSMFDLARQYRTEGMAAYARFQEGEFAAEKTHGYTAVKHQSFVGTAYLDEIKLAIEGGESVTTAMSGSTEEKQF